MGHSFINRLLESQPVFRLAFKQITTILGGEMIDRWTIVEPRSPRKGCVVGLPGRGLSADMMERFCLHMGLPNSLIICLEPEEQQWYPQPMGANNQADAVAGLEIATREINRRISRIQRAFRLKRNQIVLMGFSAGAVMAIQVMAASKTQFAAAISMAGAILEPNDLPEAMNQTPILIRHAIDDECFSWEERYIPMKNALIKKNYNVYTSEKNYGGHGVTIVDAETCGGFAAKFLGYKKEPKVETEEME